MGTRGNGVSSEAVRVELRRIIESPEFDASERNHRFLEHVVEETLAGRGGHIKAYSIATSVFGRESSFDPQADPIIRIEASRLRRSLERYYLTAGKDDPVRIDIPRGTYVPTFQDRAGDAPPPTAPVPDEIRVAVAADVAAATNNADAIATRSRPIWTRLAAFALGFAGVLLAGWLAIAWSAKYPPFPPPEEAIPAGRGPVIFVAPFEDDGGGAANSALVRGLTREVVIGLTRFNELFVFGPATSFRYGADADLPGSDNDLQVDFVVSGGVTVSGNQFRVGVTLTDAKTGRSLWSDVIERDLSVDDVFQAREIIANRVVQTLAQPYGVIFRAKSRESEGTPPLSFTSYECMLAFYRYWRVLSLPLHVTVQDCLERVVVEDPGYSEAYAALAMVYANIYRYGFNENAIAFDPMPKALDLARRSVEMAPGSVQGYKALHLVYWLMNDVERSFEAAEQGLALNPNDSEMMADLGGRLCLAGDWDRGFPLVQEAYVRNPGGPGLYRIVTFLRLYLDGRYEEALAEIEKADIPRVIHYHVLLAMAHAQLGRMKEAEADVREILKIDPDYGNNVVADMRKHNVHPDITRAVVEGLRKAGLKVSSTIRSS
jgi:TolB-like protein/tetratricopeptide (TPR) repeat protein